MTSGQGGVLTKDEIIREIRGGKLVVDGSQGQVRGCSYDLTVGTIFWDDQIYCPGTEKIVSVPPGGVIGIFTAEELKLPDDICATAFAINAMSSRGFLVLNPGHVDPGFEGPLTVKALNIRKTSIAIHQGDAIFTVIFQRLSKSTTRFEHNKPRAERERGFNATTVETSPRSISDIVAADAKGPFPSRVEVSTAIKQEISDLTARHDVEEIVRKYWMSRWSFILSVVMVAISLVTVILAGAATYFSYVQLRSSSGDTAAHALADVAQDTTQLSAKSVPPESRQLQNPAEIGTSQEGAKVGAMRVPPATNDPKREHSDGK